MELKRLPKVGEHVKFNDNLIDLLVHFRHHKGKVLEIVNIRNDFDCYHVGFRDACGLEDFIKMHSNGLIAGPNCKEMETIPVFCLCVPSWLKMNSANCDNTNEPRNNDGRAECYWCSIPTQKRGNGVYDVCPKCGK